MIGCIIDAQSHDTQFPKKIFHKFGESGKTPIELLVEAGLDSKAIHKVLVSMPSTDRPYINGSTFSSAILDLKLRRMPNFHYSDASNILMRTYNTAIEYGLDHIILLTSDCPLIPGWLITSMVVEYFKNNINTYYTNVGNFPTSFQDGLNIRIVPFWILAYAATHYEGEDIDASLGAHGTTYFENNEKSYIEKCKYTLRLTDKSQVVQLDYIINELSVGADISDIIKDINNAPT